MFSLPQMRAGTQTLIQALQALPWTKDPDNDDEIMNHSGLTPVTDSESEEEDKTRPCKIYSFVLYPRNNHCHLAPHLASSIHTIYRPLARSRKLSVGPGSQRRLGIPEYAELNDDEPVSSSLSDDEGSDDSADDFEVTTPRASDPKTPLASKASSRVGALGKATFSRTGSMATVRLQRRAMLAEKLRQIYELDGIEEVRAGTNSIDCH